MRLYAKPVKLESLLFGMFHLILFHTPARLADGLGSGSTLSIIGISPEIRVPRIHEFHEFRLH
jgi:hypothetical protein